MNKNKIILYLVLLIVLIFGGSFFVNKHRQQKEAELEEQRKIEKIALEKQAEEERKQRELEELKRKEEINRNTYYSKEAYLYEDENLQNKLEKKLNYQDKVLISDKIEDENGNVIVYKISKINDEDCEVFVNGKDVKKEKTDWIKKTYENVDYSYFDRNKYNKKIPPVKVKGLYVTQTSAANALNLLDNLLDIARTTKINTFVIDVKDDSDNLLFYSDTASKYLPEVNEKVAIDDIDSFIKKLKDENIYLVARIVSFKSPKFANHYKDKAIKYKTTGELYSDRDKLKWASPYDEELWKYIVGISKEAVDKGFDEIQFDYIRFPATSYQKDTTLDFYNQNGRNKTQCIQEFLKYAYDEISKKGAYVSADVFGWVATSIDDQNIGQHYEAMANIVDYVNPMVYPSHYGMSNFGIVYPDKYPYETVSASIKDAINRNKNLYSPAKLRPWLQDFTASYLGQGRYIPYGTNEVMAQIKALEDNGIDEFMLWNASNKYHTDGLKN